MVVTTNGSFNKRKRIERRTTTTTTITIISRRRERTRWMLSSRIIFLFLNVLLRNTTTSLHAYPMNNTSTLQQQQHDLSSYRGGANYKNYNNEYSTKSTTTTNLDQDQNISSLVRNLNDIDTSTTSDCTNDTVLIYTLYEVWETVSDNSSSRMYTNSRNWQEQQQPAKRTIYAQTVDTKTNTNINITAPCQLVIPSLLDNYTPNNNTISNKTIIPQSIHKNGYLNCSSTMGNSSTINSYHNKYHQYNHNDQNNLIINIKMNIENGVIHYKDTFGNKAILQGWQYYYNHKVNKHHPNNNTTVLLNVNNNKNDNSSNSYNTNNNDSVYTEQTYHSLIGDNDEYSNYSKNNDTTDPVFEVCMIIVCIVFTISFCCNWFCKGYFHYYLHYYSKNKIYYSSDSNTYNIQNTTDNDNDDNDTPTTTTIGVPSGGRKIFNNKQQQKVRRNGTSRRLYTNVEKDHYDYNNSTFYHDDVDNSDNDNNIDTELTGDLYLARAGTTTATTPSTTIRTVSSLPTIIHFKDIDLINEDIFAIQHSTYNTNTHNNVYDNRNSTWDAYDITSPVYGTGTNNNTTTTKTKFNRCINRSKSWDWLGQPPQQERQQRHRQHTVNKGKDVLRKHTTLQRSSYHK